jgi:hypothetical protein
MMNVQVVTRAKVQALKRKSIAFFVGFAKEKKSG